MGHEEDRERKFEQALARHLRDEAGAGSHADEVTTACADAEALAAFHERMLSSEELNAVKEHVAACSRCQEILAHLEASDDVELQAEEVGELLQPVLAGAADDREVPFARAAASPVVASKTTALKAPRSISSGRGGKLLRWVAPAGTIAAGLLIWAVVRDKPHESAPAQNIQVAQQRAEDQQAAIPQAIAPEAKLRSDKLDQLSRVENKKLPQAPGFGARSQPAEVQSRLADRVSKDSHRAGGVVGGATAGRLASEEQGRADKYLGQAKPGAPRPKSVAKQDGAASASAAPVAAADARQSGDQQAENLPVAGGNAVTHSQGANEGRKVPARERDRLSKEKLEPGVAGGAPAPSAPPAATSESVVVQTGPGAPAKLAQKKDEDSKKGAVATTSQAEVSASYARTSAPLKSKVADDSKIIVTPGGTALWRLRAAGIIERSEDRGLTWSRQDSGTTRDLVAGSAPSDVVCWIIGNTRTILRTTDGGGHWEKVAGPRGADLAGIRATDALHAMILDSAGRVKFVTGDGGVNWELVKE